LEYIAMGFADSSERWLRYLGAAALAAVTLVASPRPAAAELPQCRSTNPADWPAPAKPYFMVAFDTSGSMSGTQTPLLSANRCGYYPDRNGTARCALKNTITTFGGLVNFGLSTYATQVTVSGSPASSCPNTLDPAAGCTISPLYTGQHPTACFPIGSNCDSCGKGAQTTAAGANILVPLQLDDYWKPLGSRTPSNVNALLTWVDNICSDCKELWDSGGTPLNGILRDMYRYLSTQWQGPGVTFTTPLTDLTTERSCRSVNVILITDGEESCELNGSNPDVSWAVQAAQNLLNGWDIGTGGNKIHWYAKTYVIAVGGSLAGTDAIAAAGGTTAATVATGEQQLSSALANIVSSAILPEKCNNTDDNCNGCTDEGFRVWCNRNKTGHDLLYMCGDTNCPNPQAGLCASASPSPCAGFCCNDTRTKCLTAFNASINSVTNPDGDPWFLPCWDPATGGVAEQNWLCADPTEVCDNADNNCETTLTVASLSSNIKDEGYNKCPSCPVPETCDGVDQDCDGFIDNAQGVLQSYTLPGCAQCIKTSEICDGCDNNCNGTIDDGVQPVSCGLPTPAHCLGTKTCTPVTGQPVGACLPGGGTFSACSNTILTETCNGQDDDCNGKIDDNPTDAGGSCTPNPGDPTVGECKAGTKVCVGGVLKCIGYVGPTAEVCDGKDNNCDGNIDEPQNLTDVGAPCGSELGECQKGVWACAAGARYCNQPNSAQPEVCDGKDNDCNGITDDSLTDQPANFGCWPLPASGCTTQTCTYKTGSWCVPAGATCNDLGTLVAPCTPGTLTCLPTGPGAAAWACQGGTVPAPEQCDTVDNNCNGTNNEGLDPTRFGQPCGGTLLPACVAEGQPLCPCQRGTLICQNDQEVCSGEVQPSPEQCNGIDDDCDGTPDDGLQTTGSCIMAYDTAAFPGVRDKGLCNPGVPFCDPLSPTQVSCKGGVGPAPEICDGLDNDCDGMVDELGGPPDGISGTADPTDPSRVIGQPCGSSVGECRQGAYGCDNGRVICLGGVRPRPETCDCLDNDCDGVVDEDASPGEQPLCTTGKTCVAVSWGAGCQCASRCAGGEFPCPGGFSCDGMVTRSGTGEAVGSFCVRLTTCDDCSNQTVIGFGGVIECAPAGAYPDSSRPIPVCECKGLDGCKSPCFGVQCSSGEGCVATGPYALECRPLNDCYLFGCPQGEICVSGGCVDNPCDPLTGAGCTTDQVCKPNATYTGSVCVASCANVICAAGERCVDGSCQPTGCGRDCPAGQFCILQGDGTHQCGVPMCATIDASGTYCQDGSYCNPSDGSCGTNPCTGVKCPMGQFCSGGSCFSTKPTTMKSDAGADAAVADASPDAGADSGVIIEKEQGAFGLATGGGGCGCRLAGTTRGAAAGLMLVALSLGSLLRRRRRSVPPARTGRGEP
jgi:hypothetical protein